MTQIKTVSDHTRVEMINFYREHKVHTKYLPKIIVDGKEACIVDKSTPSGIVECDSREEARHMAIEHRDRAKARLTVIEGAQ